MVVSVAKMAIPNRIRLSMARNAPSRSGIAGGGPDRHWKRPCVRARAALPTVTPLASPLVKEQLVALVRREGPIPFEAFMEAALYGPGGFFASTELRSVKSGHFLTSPEVSPLFGETLAAYVAAERYRIGEPFTVVEVAAGSGSLLGPLVDTLGPVETWAVEVSPAAREALAGLIGAERVVDRLSAVPGPLRGVVVANELLDNLPMALAQRCAGDWRERWVGETGGDLCLVDTPPRPEVRGWLERFAGPVDEGGWVEVQLAAGVWLVEAYRRLESGSLVVFDYGDIAENLAPRRRDGTLRTYRAHHLGPHPLDEPGATDITADVNFTAMAAVLEEEGARVGIERQDDFLGRWGLRRRISELRRRELDVARAGDEMGRLRLTSARTEAETLMHPRGLGDFRVLVATRP
jgi:SAM-dependent MidA family methyltransferase